MKSISIRMAKVVFAGIFIVAGCFGAFAQRVILDVSISNPYLMADSRQTTFLKVGLTGFELAGETDRSPVNVAIVLDRSGSMEGEKIDRAKDAAILAVNMLDERDIVSIVTYSDGVYVLVPSTRITDKEDVRRMIRSIHADGSTALFAGVSKGANELRKFFDRQRVNRVILLSDGLANVGPDSPGALGDLGASLRREGISVTTIGLGLGYNEDLMVQLAQRSDGNHSFVENTRDLARIFRYEFNDVLSVVAQEIEISIHCAPGIVPIRVLGRDADIADGVVYTSINQLYSNQEKYILLEVDVSPQSAGKQLPVATIDVNYGNMVSGLIDSLSSSADVQFTASDEVSEQNVNRETMADAVLQIATEQSQRAVSLRDEGKLEEAEEILIENAEFLLEKGAALQAPELEGYGMQNLLDAEAVDDEEEWQAKRKEMRDQQHDNQSQQSY